ncbi:MULTISPECIES: peptidoglycan-binding domain-containing protein [unclassified Kribbella]|uniref:peptidoglycan-binding domain-containing protein n=1 Tax=unclassified Kribbella TaxID=2644121 RepID=UPI0033DF083D
MATKAYRDWVAAGKPWKKATPIAELEALARKHGVKVLGTLGDKGHLTDATPEDHTPFTIDAWPGKLPGYVVTAIDLQNAPGLGARLLADAKAGKAPWVKYLNFGGKQFSARRDWRERSHSDQHLHVSIRSDWCSRSIGSYNPFSGTGVIGPQPGGGKLVVDGQLGPKTYAALQTALNKHGSGLAVDGKFGPQTKKALQKYLGVTPDGGIGPITVKALQAKVGAGVDGTWGSATTRKLQEALNAGKF